MIVEVDRATSDTTSQVMLIDAAPAPAQPTAPFGPDAIGTPFTIIDNEGKTAETYSVYLQDEWKLAHNLTLNYGVRFDQFDGFVDQNQLSPRINLVWLPTPSTTIHLGYASYFTPPPFELVAQESVQKFIDADPRPAGHHLDRQPGGRRLRRAGRHHRLPAGLRGHHAHRRARQLLRRRARSRRSGSHLTLTIDSY